VLVLYFVGRSSRAVYSPSPAQFVGSNPKGAWTFFVCEWFVFRKLLLASIKLPWMYIEICR